MISMAQEECRSCLAKELYSDKYCQTHSQVSAGPVTQSMVTYGALIVSRVHTRCQQGEGGVYCNMCYVVVEECVVKGGRGRHIDTNCRTQGMPRCQLKYPKRNRQRAIQLIH